MRLRGARGMLGLRGLFLIVLLGAIIGFFSSGWRHQFSLEALKSHQQFLAAYRQAHELQMAAGFAGIYIAFTALSLPAAALLTVAGGALFGLLEGTLLVSFAASIGATLAFLASRFVFRDAVQRHFADRVAAVDREIRREGAFYLLTLRLVPVVPYFIVNLLMGLTSLRLVTFYWVSQVGMLASTVVFVNAGTQLAELDSISGVLSAKLIGSLLSLALLPLLARWAVAGVKRRRVYARWPAPRRFDRNLVVIGAGSGGLIAAYVAATVRASVTLIEAHQMGGDCLNTGCVPSKALIHRARMLARMKQAATAGIRADGIAVDFSAVMDGVRGAIARVAPHDSMERYRQLGVDVRHGHARILSPWQVQVDGVTLSTRAIVIASGAEPVVPPLPGLEGSVYFTSETLWGLRELPKRLMVLGGGPIGCELAQAFARLGSRVTQVQSAQQLLVREDEEVAEFVRLRLLADGVDVRLGCRAIRIERDGESFALLCSETSGESRLPYDALLIATGRRPRTRGFGLEELGIPSATTVETDTYLATMYPNIYACGDVAGPFQFTHTAAHQAWYAAVNALFGQVHRFRADYRVIPAVTFVDPEVARVGITEREARERNIPHEITRYDLKELDRAITEDQAHGFLKVLTPPGKDRILGVAIVGEHAGELLAEFALAMRHGLGLGKILSTIHAYPTWVEANRSAAGSWRAAHAPERLLRLAARFHTWRRR